LWKKQLESSNFQEALKMCEQNNFKYYTYVEGVIADSRFKNAKFAEAADLYAKSNKSFEEVVMKFLMAGENDGLESTR
jgi:hypothetical protein